MPAADRNKPKPGHKHLNTLNVPDADLAAISHAAIDAGQTRMEYIRALIHADAERVRAKQKPASVFRTITTTDFTRAPGYKFDFTITGIDTETADDLLLLLLNRIENAHGEMGGGYTQVDRNGNPVT